MRADFSSPRFGANRAELAHWKGELYVDLRDTDLFGAITSGAKLAGADLRGGELSGLDLTALASRDGLKITADQQYALLSALGIDVTAD